MAARKPKLEPRARSNALRRVEMTDAELRAACHAIRYVLRDLAVVGYDWDAAVSAMVEMRRAFGGRQ